jgi:hypothetical protein
MTSITRDAEGRLVLPQPFPFVARIFGALFALPGLKLLRDFVSGLIDAGGAVSFGVGDVFGLILFLFFMLVFLVLGWVMATIRRRVTLDPSTRGVVQTNDFLVYRWTNRRSLDDFDSIRVFLPRRTSSSSSKRPMYHVDLNAERKSVILLLTEDEDEARQVGRELGQLTGLPLRDEIRHDRDDEADEDEDETEEHDAVRDRS